MRPFSREPADILPADRPAPKLESKDEADLARGSSTLFKTPRAILAAGLIFFPTALRLLQNDPPNFRWKELWLMGSC